MADTQNVPIETKEERDVPTAGGRKKLRLAKKKTVRRILRKMGLKMRGGMDALTPEPVSGGGAPMGASGAGSMAYGGRRKSRRGTRRGRKSRRSLFGMIKY